MNMAEQTLTIECRYCKATGLYKGFIERGSAAVVCTRCEGKGAEKIQITPFTEIKERNDITKVFTPQTTFIIDDTLDGGVTYDEWRKDPQSVYQHGKETRSKYCPKLHYMYKEEEPHWALCEEMWGVSITECPKYPEKSDCWQRWDAEMASKASAS